MDPFSVDDSAVGEDLEKHPELVPLSDRPSEIRVTSGQPQSLLVHSGLGRDPRRRRRQGRASKVDGGVLRAGWPM